MLRVQQTSLRQVQSGRCKEPGSGRNSGQSCHASPRWPAPRLPVARDILTLLVWPLQQNFSNVKLNPKLVASQTLEKWWDFKQAEVEGKISEHSRTGACVGHVLRKQGQVQRRGWERQTGPGAEPRSCGLRSESREGLLVREQHSLGKLMLVPRHRTPGAWWTGLAAGEEPGARAGGLLPSNPQHLHYIPACWGRTWNLRNHSTANSLPSGGAAPVTFLPPALAQLEKHSQSPLALKSHPALSVARVRPQASSPSCSKREVTRHVHRNKPDLGSLMGKWKWGKYPVCDDPEQAPDPQAATRNKFFPDGTFCVYVFLWFRRLGPETAWDSGKHCFQFASKVRLD